jgi:phospholipid transport system substrate-binding protein
MSTFSSNELKSAIVIGRRFLLAHATATTVVLTVAADGRVARAADTGNPTLPIQQLHTALLTVMKAGRATPFTQRYALLDPAVMQAFDLDAVLRAAVGLAWNSTPPDQQAALANTFRRYTVSNYVANFDSYDGQAFRILPEARTLSNGEIVIRTEIVRPGKPAVEIDYVMRQSTEGWKAVDVLSDGTISQVAVQRSDFRGLISSGGAPALRAGLNRKVAALSSGALA